MPSCSASALERSRLSVGSSSKSRVDPASSSSKICRRACCPPDKVRNGCRALNWISYRASAAIASLRKSACSVMRISSGQRSARSGRAWVLTDRPRTTLAPRAGSPSVRKLLPAEQPQERGLAGPVGAEHRDPLAVPDLGGERPGEARQLQVLADDGALSGPAAAQPHPDVLFSRRQFGRARIFEPFEPGLRGLQPRSHRVVIGRLLAGPPDALLDLLVFLIRGAAQLIEALGAVPAGLRVGREATAVDPDALVLHRDDALSAVGEQFPVVAYQEHGLAGRGEL